MATILISSHWKVRHYHIRLVGLISSVLLCLYRRLYVCIRLKILTRKDLICILCRGMAYTRVAHMIFLGARNSWKARRVWPRLHAISCSARRQIGLRYFSDTSHIENKLKKIHSFLWQETWGVFSQYGCVREHTVAVVGPWTFPVEGSKTGFNRSLLLPLEHQLLIFVSIYCRPPYHLHPQRIRF